MVRMLRAGTFWALMAAVAGMADHDVSTLALADNLGNSTAPVIEYQPTPQVAILGGEVRFTVIASGDPAPTYQWRKDGHDLSEGGRLEGVTTSVLWIREASFGDAGNYSVAVTNPSGSDTSVDAPLQVNTPQGGDVDFGFDPGSSANGTIFASAVQAGGKIFVGGSFTSVDGAARGRIARLNADGTADHTFGAGFTGADGTVMAVAVQPDGKVLIGGYFDRVNGASRSRIARLNADGSLDTTFMDGLGGADDDVWSVAVQPDGRILIGGDFTAVNGVSRNHIARLEADGSLDATFLNGLAGTDNRVACIAVQPDGRALIAGAFTVVNGVGRNRIARLNADGSLDTTFMDGQDGANDQVFAIRLQADGRVLVGGGFIWVNGRFLHGLARLNADGSLDPTFLDGQTGVESTVWSIAVQADGKILIGGQFYRVNNVSRSKFARLNPDGSLDPTFADGVTGADRTVYSIEAQVDGQVVVGGEFITVNGMHRSYIARLNSEGNVDPGFRSGLTGANAGINSVAVQSDGRVLIGGYFTSVSGESRNRTARLNVDGSLDTVFMAGLAGADNVVYSVVLQPDDRVLVGGYFTQINGASRKRIARLHADGTPDATFMEGMSGADATVYAVALQPDDRVLIAGAFAHVNNIQRNHTARLNTDGSVDINFLNEIVDGTVFAIALQPDGRVLLGGSFTRVGGASRNRIARLNANGSLDTGFLDGLSGAGATVRSVALQSDGRVLIGGDFTTVNGASRNHIARLNADGSLDTSFLSGLSGTNATVSSIALQPDGRIVIGGDFTTVNDVTEDYIARLNPDGSIDSAFLGDSVGANGPVRSIGVQPDGRLVIGGDFGGFNGFGRTSVARLYGSPPVSPSIAVEPSSASSYDGCCATFMVEATGTPLNYQWRKDGQELMDGPGILGSRAAKLTLTGLANLDEGAYSVVVSNVLGSDTSADAMLTVSPVPACHVPSCDPDLGCILTEVPDGTSCDLDGNACATADVCQAGICLAGGPLSCDDGNGCTDDACDPASGCTFTNSTNPCDDGDECTLGDTCAGGSCVGTPITLTFYQDADGDRYGNPDASTVACHLPSGYVNNPDDCDDTDPTIRPGGAERCDQRRNDCSDPNWPVILDDDFDGTENACESCIDYDGDGWGNPEYPANTCADDNCPWLVNPDQADPDYDGKGTPCDACPFDPADDEDGDGICGDVDNCPLDPNPVQENADGDALGDACDDCPNVISRSNADLDKDGIPDACDPDVDGDGIPNETDPDDDADSIPDDDGDGMIDPCPDGVTTDCDDNCAVDPNVNQRDRDGDGIGDACDPSDDLVHGGEARKGGSLPGSYVFSWEREYGAVAYNVYADLLSSLSAGSVGACYRNRIATVYTTMDHQLAAGEGAFYLATAVYAEREGSLGDRSDGTERLIATPCP